MLLLATITIADFNKYIETLKRLPITEDKI
jgi:hypothetical protein